MTYTPQVLYAIITKFDDGKRSISNLCETKQEALELWSVLESEALSLGSMKAAKAQYAPYLIMYKYDNGQIHYSKELVMLHKYPMLEK